MQANIYKYKALRDVLDNAYYQASVGKGEERHANDKPFEKQPILEISRMVGPGYLLGQAMKKCQESMTLYNIKGTEAACAELLGAINYVAAAVIHFQEKGDKPLTYEQMLKQTLAEQEQVPVVYPGMSKESSDEEQEADISVQEIQEQ